jgi:hypothetical protein
MSVSGLLWPRIREDKTPEWIALAAGLTVLKSEREWSRLVQEVLGEMVEAGEAVRSGKLYQRGSNLPAMRWDRETKRVVPVAVEEGDDAAEMGDAA